MPNRSMEEYRMVVSIFDSTSQTLSLSEKDKEGVGKLIEDNLQGSKHLPKESDARNFVYSCVIAYFLEEIVEDKRDVTMSLLRSVKKLSKDFEDGVQQKSGD